MFSSGSSVFLFCCCIFYKNIRFSCRLDIVDLINLVALFLTVVSRVLALKPPLNLRYVVVSGGKLPFLDSLRVPTST